MPKPMTISAGTLRVGSLDNFGRPIVVGECSECGYASEYPFAQMRILNGALYVSANNAGKAT